MARRQCEDCGASMAPFWRRRRHEDGRLLCDACSAEPGGGLVTKGARIWEGAVGRCKFCDPNGYDKPGRVMTLGNCHDCDGFRNLTWRDRNGDPITGERTVKESLLVTPVGEETLFGDGEYEFICPKCGDHRVSQGKYFAEVEAQRHLDWHAKQASVRKQAHDSGDGQRVYHCFSGDTEYLTCDGVRTFADTVGTHQMVLTSRGGRTEGEWTKAEIREFGEQQLWKLTVRRNKKTKEILTTSGHRWMIGRAGREYVRTTENLISGHRLAWVASPRLTGVAMDEAGIRAGIIFGDGTSIRDRYATINLWGAKDAQLLGYFSSGNQTPIVTSNGVPGVRVTGVHLMDASMKSLPSLLESDDGYLLGWLAGYFAADGTVSKSGQVLLHSASLGNIEFVRDVCVRLGIATYSITSKMRFGFGKLRPLHSIQIASTSLDGDFFLIDEQRTRWARLKKNERLGWTVVGVEPTNRVETVYCAVVPETASFALLDHIWTKNCCFCGSGAVVGRSDGTIECQYCKNYFTVQVQPQYSNLPQTDPNTGQPIFQPGMPGSIDRAGLDAAPGVDEGPKVGQPPEEEIPRVGQDPVEDEPVVGGVPKESMFINANGLALDAERYMRHLAIECADDPEAVLLKVKAMNSPGRP